MVEHLVEGNVPTSKVNRELIDVAWQASDAGLDKAKVFCTSRATNDDSPALTARGYARPRMWAQYGGNHSGVCLVFDRHELDCAFSHTVPQNEHLISGPVTYSDSPKAYSLPSLDVTPEHAKGELHSDTIFRFYCDNARHLFFHKHSDWIGEAEYRWVLVGREGGYQTLSMKAALRAAVYCGNQPSAYVSSLTELCNRYGAAVRQIKWSAHEGDYQPYDSVEFDSKKLAPMRTYLEKSGE